MVWRKGKTLIHPGRRRSGSICPVFSSSFSPTSMRRSTGNGDSDSWTRSCASYRKAPWAETARPILWWNSTARTGKRPGCWFTSRFSPRSTTISPTACSPTISASTLYTYDTEGRPSERRRHKFRLVRNLYEAGLDKEQIISFFRLVDWIMSLPKDEQDRFTDELEDWTSSRESCSVRFSSSCLLARSEERAYLQLCK